MQSIMYAKSLESSSLCTCMCVSGTTGMWARWKRFCARIGTVKYIYRIVAVMLQLCDFVEGFIYTSFSRSRCEWYFGLW